MSSVAVAFRWEPKVLGRTKLDARRWAYALERFHLNPARILRP
jgi:hypothetical protein